MSNRRWLSLVNPPRERYNRLLGQYRVAMINLLGEASAVSPTFANLPSYDSQGLLISACSASQLPPLDTSKLRLTPPLCKLML